MRKKLTSCIVACALLLCGAVATMNAATKTTLTAAETSWDWTNDYESTSVSGQSYTGTAIPLSSTGTKLSGTYSLDDLASGFMFQIVPNTVDTIVADHMQIIIRDSVDSSKLVSVWLETNNTNGSYTSSYASLAESFTRNSDGWVFIADTEQGVVAYAQGWFNTYESGLWKGSHGTPIHGKNENGESCTTTGFYGVFGTNSTNQYTSAVKLTYSDNTVKVNGLLVADLEDSDYLKYSSNKLDQTDAAQKAIADKYTEDYVNGLFSSGLVTVEFSFGATYNGSANNAYKGKVNLISVGAKSLAKIKEDEPPKIEIDSPYYDLSLGAFVFEKGREYRFSDLKSKIAKATDNVDENPTIDLEVYNAQNVKYTVCETISFTDGDYFKIIAQDCNGNKAEMKTNALSLFTVDIPQKIYAELQSESVRYGVLTALPSGYGYTTALYAKADVEYESPLTEEALYEFDDIGGYVVAFRVYNDELSIKTYFVELEVVDKTAPVMNFEKEYEAEYSMNERVKLLRPELSDNNKNGSPTLAMKAYFGGNEVTVTDDTIVLNQIGTYEIEYTATDKSGNISVERKAVVNRGNDFLAPKIVLSGEYKTSYTVGSKIKLVAATVTDNVDASPVVKVEVVLNGKLLTEKDGSVKPDESGTLNIVYTAVDASGNQSTHIVRAETVAKKKSGCKGSVSSTVGVVGLGVAVASLLKKRKEKKDEK